MKSYESYASTGYDWLPQVPAHWRRIPLRGITRISDARNGSRTDLELLSVYREYGVIPKASRSDNHNVESENLSNYKYVGRDYLVMNKMKMWQGSLGVSMYEGIVSPAYIVCRILGNDNTQFLHRMLRTPQYKVHYNRFSKGIRVGQWDFSYDNFKNLYVYLPPRAEQDQIVRFLDWKLSEINSLIRGKRKQLVLIKDIITTLTSNAIERDGVDTYRLINITEPCGAYIERVPDAEYMPIGLLNRGRGIFRKPLTTGDDLGDSNFYSVEDNALIFSGQFAWEGAVALTSSEYEGCIASHRYHMIRAKTGIVNNEFLWAFFQTKRGDLLLNTHSRGGAGRNRPLNINTLRKESMLIPPIEEQETIANEVKIYFQYVKTIKDLELLLAEYRNRMISDVVTGKVDVRDIEIPDVSIEDSVAEEADDAEIDDEGSTDEIEEVEENADD